MRKSVRTILLFSLAALFLSVNGCGQEYALRFERAQQEAEARLPLISEQLEEDVLIFLPALIHLINNPSEKGILFDNSPEEIEAWSAKYGNDVGNALKRLYEVGKSFYWNEERQQFVMTVYKQGRSSIRYVYELNPDNYTKYKKLSNGWRVSVWE